MSRQKPKELFFYEYIIKKIAQKIAKTYGNFRANQGFFYRGAGGFPPRLNPPALETVEFTIEPEDNSYLPTGIALKAVGKI